MARVHGRSMQKEAGDVVAPFDLVDCDIVGNGLLLGNINQVLTLPLVAWALSINPRIKRQGVRVGVGARLLLECIAMEKGARRPC